MKALLVTFDKYPDLDAGAVRIHMFGKMLIDIGYDVYVISMGPSTGFKETIEPDKIKHISYRGKHKSRVFKALYYLSFPFRLKHQINNIDFDVIIHTQVDVHSLRLLQAYGRKKKIPVIFDCVEWFSKSQFSNGDKSRAYKLNNMYNEKLIAKPSSVISISSYLENHFKNKGLKSIKIPVVIDTSESVIKYKHDNSLISLLYAGSPGRKDYIDNVIYAIDLLEPDERKHVIFTILGCTADQIKDVCGVNEDVLNRIKDSLIIRGRVSRTEVIKAYSTADFSILIRHSDERYAKAGFPTKFVESINYSTPVICNVSSDLGEYLINGVNSIVLDSITPDAIANILRSLLLLDTNKLASMKEAAKRTAITYFDYKIYEDKLYSLINDDSNEQ